MLLHLVLAAISLQDSTLTYDGRAQRIRVDVPRIDTFSPKKEEIPPHAISANGI